MQPEYIPPARKRGGRGRGRGGRGGRGGISARRQVYEEEEEEEQGMDEERAGQAEGKQVAGESLPEVEYRFFTTCRKEIASDVVYNQFLQLLDLYAKVGMNSTNEWR